MGMGKRTRKGLRLLATGHGKGAWDSSGPFNRCFLLSLDWHPTPGGALNSVLSSRRCEDGKCSRRLDRPEQASEPLCVHGVPRLA